MNQLYTTDELQRMTPDELRAAQANGFVKTSMTVENVSLPDSPPTPPASPQGAYTLTTWGAAEYDFVVPSGQRCRMRKLRPEALIEKDPTLIDRISVLPGFAQEQIDKAEGLPPKKLQDQKEQFAMVVSVVNELLPEVVVLPVVLPIPAEGQPRKEGAIYVDDIELADRVAIMERAVQGVAKLAPFRAEA
jgi:hypothetical protein